MLFLSHHSHLSPNSSTYSYSSIQIFSSLLPDPNNHNHSSASLPIPKDPKSHSDGAIKVPTPPWMKGPLLLQSHELLDFSNPNAQKRFNKGHVEEHEPSDKALTGKEVRGKKAMKKVVQRVEKLHKTQNSAETQMVSAKVENFEGCLERLKENEEMRTRGRMPWEKDNKILYLRMKKEKALTAADLTLDKVLLQRLRGEAARMRTWLKVKKAGVTQAVVEEIKRIWRRNELAMVKFDIPLCRNMDRAREIVETKTGGLVVWSKKDALVVYRGCNRQLTSKASPKIYSGYIHNQRTNPYAMNWVESVTEGDLYWVKSNHITSDILSWNADRNDSISTGIQDMNFQPVSGSLYERETDRLLDGLGPRFIDWWMRKPLPVDADLLPEVVPGFKPPFRLCPPHVSAKLTDNELTYLRKLAQPLPTHFVLGRNERLQGLAAAILQLWEKSLIAKIAIKYGIPNTDNETMANELKLNKKIERSARELSKLNAAWTPAEEDADLEIMTDEERECFRKLGLKMDSCLVLGRRGVFDGVLEGLHQHWKHREVVKVITMQRLFSQVFYTAKLLETESGGILVSVDKLKEGHAIIIYRGKNYSRPLKKVAKNLLTKREALHRSLEMQRIGSLKFFAHQRQQTISDLKLRLADLQQRKEIEQREFDN